MRIQFILIFLFSFSLAFCQVKQDTLTNEKLVKMVKSGISDNLIMKSIVSSKFSKFDLSSDGLIELKRNKVSDSLILVLFDKTSVQKNDINNSPNANNLSKKNNDNANNKLIDYLGLESLQPGIYFFNTQTQKYNKLSGTKSSMQMERKLNLFTGVKFVYNFNGSSAQIKLKNTQPEFYMILGNNLSGTVFEPSRFVLIKVDSNKEKRTIALHNGMLGKSLGGPSTFSTKDGMIAPIYSEINNNVYKITFEKKLQFGNYFFGPSQILGDLPMEFFEFDVKN
jgi:hypothetical protein